MYWVHVGFQGAIQVSECRLPGSCGCNQPTTPHAPPDTDPGSSACLHRRCSVTVFNRSSPDSTLMGSSTSGTIQRARRSIHYTLTSCKLTASSSTAAPVAILFPPLASTSAFIGTAEFVSSAAVVGLTVLSVDRPGIGGTSPAPRRWIQCARSRLATHSADVVAVCNSLGIDRVRLIGVCAGAPFALAFAAAHPTLAECSHLTLVTPWVYGDCPFNQWIVRTAAAGWFGPRTCIGPLLLLTQAVRIHRILFAAKRGRVDEAVANATAGFSTSERGLLTRRCALDSSLAPRLVQMLRHDIVSQSEGGFAGDVAVCLSPAKVLQQAGPSVPKRITVVAAVHDELVPLPATKSMCDWLRAAGATVDLFAFGGGTHAGVHYLRQVQWLQCAASVGRDLGAPDTSSVVRRGAHCTDIRLLPTLREDREAEAAAASAAVVVARSQTHSPKSGVQDSV